MDGSARSRSEDGGSNILENERKNGSWIWVVGRVRKMMYADDLAIIAESKQEIQEVMESWKRVFKKHGLRIGLGKTDLMWVGHHGWMHAN